MRSKQVGVLLALARTQLKISQAELARRAGVSTQIVADIERGTRPDLGLDVVLAVFEAAGVSFVLREPHDASSPLSVAPAENTARQTRAAAGRQGQVAPCPCIRPMRLALASQPWLGSKPHGGSAVPRTLSLPPVRQLPP